MSDAASSTPQAGSEAANLHEMARAMIASNHAELLRAARGQRFSFITMKWMFLVIFLVALGAMIAAVRVATTVPATGFEWSQAGVVAALGAASILLFAVVLYMRPLATLERNSVVNAFLTVVINSYWSRMLYVDTAEDPAAFVDAVTAYTADHLGVLLDRQHLGASQYMDLVRESQDEEGLDPYAYGSPL